MWRPKEGWNNPHTKMEDGSFASIADAHFRQLDDSKHTAFEAGADAILEALKKEGEYVHNSGTAPYGYVLGRSLNLGEKGHLVFIPEE